jgi:hypothetical protein
MAIDIPTHINNAPNFVKAGVELFRYGNSTADSV